MRPLLAQTYEPHRVTFPCFVQPKLNGVRALYQGGRFQSRDEIPFPEILLQHLAEPLSKTFDESIILDGELYVHGWPLQRILGAVTPVRQEATSDTQQIQFHIFDSVDYTKSFIERIRYITFENEFIRQVPLMKVSSEQAANEWYVEWVQQRYEGMMYRLGDCPYTTPKQPRQAGQRLYSPRTPFLSDKDNRVWHLLKRKDWQDETFLFESINSTIGEQGFPGFQMWLMTKNYRRFKVSSGLTRAQVEHYLIPENQPSQVKIKFLVYSEDGIPLNATVEAMI